MRWLVFLLPLLLTSPAHSKPGDVLTIRTSATVDGVTVYAETIVCVLNPAFSNRVFYVCPPYSGEIAGGIRTRFPRCIGADILIRECVVTSDGKLFFDGKVLEP